MMTQWLAYIRLFDFCVKRISGTKYGGADALSRRGNSLEDLPETKDEADDYFDAKLYSIQISDGTSFPPTARIYLHDAEYEGDDLILG